MPIHREGYATIASVGLLAAVVSALAYRLLPRPLFRLVTITTAVTVAFFTQFFRNPQRVTPSTGSGIFAPADGTIVAIEPVTETEYFHDECLKISIYMSAFNVHVNRVPCDGNVIYSRYHPGKYLVAFHPKASELNERNTVVIEQTDGQRVLIRQIAGLLARRIRYYLTDGQAVHAGDELGFIKFGSRCDVFLPLDATVKVHLEQAVTGGETLLAVLKIDG